MIFVIVDNILDRNRALLGDDISSIGIKLYLLTYLPELVDHIWIQASRVGLQQFVWLKPRSVHWTKLYYPVALNSDLWIHISSVWIIGLLETGERKTSRSGRATQERKLTHHGPTRSPASSPESAARPMARSRVSVGLPGSQHAYNPHFPRTSGHWAAQSLD